MADRLTIDVDTRALLAAMDRIPDLVLKHTKAAAKVTAENIQREARARVARRTGRTALGIHVEEDRARAGYVVLSGDPELETRFRASGNNAARPANVPLWLEFGTMHMTARPFFFDSARLEANAHDRRMREAIGDAIAEAGLGD